MKNKILIPTILASVMVIAVMTMIFTVMDSESNAYEYTPSDISKANSNITAGDGSASMDTTEPSKWKTNISHTVRGEVLSVGDPISWNDKWDETYGAVPVTLKVKETTKGNHEDTITFYMHGMWERDDFYLMPYEAQFEVGEKVLVHLGVEKAFNFEEGVLYLQLGEHGKYRIIHDKAYNEDFPQGKSLDSAKKESK